MPAKAGIHDRPRALRSPQKPTFKDAEGEPGPSGRTKMEYGSAWPVVDPGLRRDDAEVSCAYCAAAGASSGFDSTTFVCGRDSSTPASMTEVVCESSLRERVSCAPIWRTTSGALA